MSVSWVIRTKMIVSRYVHVSIAVPIEDSSRICGACRTGQVLLVDVPASLPQELSRHLPIGPTHTRIRKLVLKGTQN